MPDARAHFAASERIAICLCTRFAPAVGGIETLAEMLAREWARSGHGVIVVTDVPEGGERKPARQFQVYRKPGVRELLQVVRATNVVVHLNISLKMVWPLLVVRKPLIATHHSWYCTREAPDKWRERLKRHIARKRAVNISCSEAVRDALACGGEVIPNPYDHERFRDLGVPRDGDLAFVGRLVSDKGVDVLIRALKRLRDRGLQPGLTVVGDGPERPNLQKQAAELGLSRQVEFIGNQGHNALPANLNRHRILVVPSQWDEPFGIVALEGAACGCVIVGSAGGGLPEAIGPCGLTFPNGDDAALAKRLEYLLVDDSRLEPFRIASKEHLARHRADVVAKRYLEVIRRSMAS